MVIGRFREEGGSRLRAVTQWMSSVLGMEKGTSIAVPMVSISEAADSSKRMLVWMDLLATVRAKSST